LYSPCEYVPIEGVSWPGVAAVPNPPCQSLCKYEKKKKNTIFFSLLLIPFFRKFVQNCKGIIPDTSLPDCNAIDPNTNQPLFPEKRFRIEKLNASVRCFEDPSQKDFEYNCPKDGPLLYDGRNDPPCSLKCPDPHYSSVEFSLSAAGWAFFSSIGLILVTFLTISYLINPSLRK
jgi:hypothetical protein